MASVDSHAAARQNMIDCQILPNRVTDPAVLRAFADVPRENFVPAAHQGVAYLDKDLPLGGGRVLMEPMIAARLLQAAELDGSEKALVAGAGSGYLAALLGHLVNAVVAVEDRADLLALARTALAGAAGITLVEGAPAEGAKAAGPYDLIILGGAAEQVPAALFDQLAPEGKLIAVIRQGGVGKATLFTRPGGVQAARILFDAATPALPEFAMPKTFAL